jgi:hypothetical protein
MGVNGLIVTHWNLPDGAHTVEFKPLKPGKHQLDGRLWIVVVPGPMPRLCSMC